MAIKLKGWPDNRRDVIREWEGPRRSRTSVRVRRYALFVICVDVAHIIKMYSKCGTAGYFRSMLSHKHDQEERKDNVKAEHRNPEA